MAVENINNMTEGLAPADRSDVKDKNFKMPKAPGDKYIKSAINLLSKRTPLGIGITAAKSALPYVDDAVKFIKRKDPFGLFKRQQLGSKEMENLSKNPKIRSMFKDGKNQLIKGHALEPNAASVIPETKGMKDFSIYETIPKELMENLVMKKSPDVRRPQFFTTTKGNKIHEKLGASLIKDLVEKYRIQGYVFRPDKNKKGGEWIFDEKIIPENQIEKIKEINKSINYKESKLKELKLQTMFYNPAKDRLVFFGEGPTSLTDLKKAMMRRGFNNGGIVGISHLIRPL
jgi:hypothetical protein